MKKRLLWLGIIVAVFVVGVLVGVNISNELSSLFHNSVSKMISSTKVVSEAVAAVSPYVGVDKCKKCHVKDYAEYSKFKYSRNYRILELRGRGEEKSPKCLPCHTTGYGKGGFISAEKTPHLKNVQCEACHGPAREHVNNPWAEGPRRALRIPRNVCTACHKCMSTHLKYLREIKKE